MGTRRGNGEGSVSRRADGRWMGRVTLEDASGKVQRHHVYGKTRAEAVRNMREVRKRADEGKPLVDSRTSVAAWVEVWQGSILAASSRKEVTKQGYRQLARHHLTPAPLGAKPLAEVKPRDIDAVLVSLRDEKHLADSTIRQVYTVARAVFDGAVRDGLLGENPVAKVGRPGVRRTEARFLEPDEVRAVLAAGDRTRYGGALRLIAGTGIRRGEALGLAWDDVDVAAGVAHIRRTLSRVNGRLILTEPKTENSRRDVPLGADVLAVLKAQADRQAAELLRAGDQWQESGLVFTTELGTAVDPRNLFRTMQLATEKAGVEGAGVHSLRHSAATAMLGAGVPLHVVSRILGHSSVAITGDIYGHVSDSRAREAIAKLEAAFK